MHINSFQVSQSRGDQQGAGLVRWNHRHRQAAFTKHTSQMYVRACMREEIVTPPTLWWFIHMLLFIYFCFLFFAFCCCCLCVAHNTLGAILTKVFLLHSLMEETGREAEERTRKQILDLLQALEVHDPLRKNYYAHLKNKNSITK